MNFDTAAFQRYTWDGEGGGDRKKGERVDEQPPQKKRKGETRLLLEHTTILFDEAYKALGGGIKKGFQF